MTTPIYVVNCYYYEDKQSLKDGKKISPLNFERYREWGYFHDVDSALRCIKENWTDIYENGYYNFAMLEERYPGITVGHKNKHYWFCVEFNDKTNTYKIEFIDSCFFTSGFTYNFQKKIDF
jgi:hypothetical protein